MALLLSGDFERGLVEYEWRTRGAYAPVRAFTQPRWDGSPLAGRTILMYAEAALGDTIQFVRYACLAKAQGAKVIVECQRPLYRLLTRCRGIDHLVGRDDPLPTCDVWVQLMSLPYFFRTRLDTVPADIPYLGADPALVQQWRGELTALLGLKIGIAWKGSPHADADGRSIPVTEFAPLAAIPGVRLVSFRPRTSAAQATRVLKELGRTGASSWRDQSGQWSWRCHTWSACFSGWKRSLPDYSTQPDRRRSFDVW